MKGKKKKEGCPLVGHFGPTRAGAPCLGATPHVGIVPHGGAKRFGTPVSPFYSPPAWKKSQKIHRKSEIDFWLTWASPWVDSTLLISRRVPSQVWIVHTGDLLTAVHRCAAGFHPKFSLPLFRLDRGARESSSRFVHVRVLGGAVLLRARH